MSVTTSGAICQGAKRCEEDAAVVDGLMSPVSRTLPTRAGPQLGERSVIEPKRLAARRPRQRFWTLHEGESAPDRSPGRSARHVSQSEDRRAVPPEPSLLTVMLIVLPFRLMTVLPPPRGATMYRPEASRVTVRPVRRRLLAAVLRDLARKSL